MITELEEAVDGSGSGLLEGTEENYEEPHCSHCSIGLFIY
jgi:hypothetical protein